MKIISLILLSVISFIATNCGNSIAHKKVNVINKGMLFETADKILINNGAKTTMFQVEFTKENVALGFKVHYYVLPSDLVCEMVSKPNEKGRIVDSISVSSYQPKSVKSKLDPEREKFWASFKSYDSYEFEAELKN